jgi:hypothetical protein
MPRIILLLLILAALVILALQNLSISVSLVILGSSRTPEIPFGLLLVGALCMGALITLVLYGLVGLQRPPESKYRPLGRRVPYPESPGSVSPSGTPYSPASPYSSSTSSSPRSGSTAFVSEPKVPQDTVPDSSQKSTQNRDSYNQSSFSTVASNHSEPLPSPEPPFTVRKPPFFFRGDKPEKKKAKRQDPLANARIGDNWGERRTAEHFSSWDEGSSATQNSSASGQKRGFFDFIGIGNPPPNTDQLTEDIAAGWDENSGYAANDVARDDRAYDYRAGDDYGYDNRYDNRSDSYDEDLDSGWENFEGYDDSRASGNDSYRPSDRRSDRYSDAYSDRYSDRPSNRPLENGDKRVYRDGLYGDRRDETFRDEGYDDDGVYEADYRVIVPPSKSLDEGPLDEGPPDKGPLDGYEGRV